MEVLALIHQEDAPPGTFGDVVAEHGHSLDVHGFATGNPPPAGALDRYGAVLVFGGAQQVDEPHGWLTPERALVRDLLAREVPTLGVCLGAQLVAGVAGGRVGPAPAPEIGWHEVSLTSAAADDPLLRAAPARFAAFQWHSYGFTLPPGAIPLAHGPDGALQACRIGPAAWAIQFHAEVNAAIIDDWIEDDSRREPRELADADARALSVVTAANLPRWVGFGRGLCGRFLEWAVSA